MFDRAARLAGSIHPAAKRPAKVAVAALPEAAGGVTCSIPEQAGNLSREDRIIITDRDD
jgi:hypothetical protein